MALTVKGNSLRLTWDPVDGVHHYLCVLSRPNIPEPASANGEKSIDYTFRTNTEREWVLLGLQPGAEYRCTVYAIRVKRERELKMEIDTFVVFNETFTVSVFIPAHAMRIDEAPGCRSTE